MNELTLFIQSRNAKTAAWVAEDPANRWAMGLVDDADHWAKVGVHTPAELEHYLLAADVYDTHKSVWGFRPSWAGLMAMSSAELEAELEALAKQAQRQREENAKRRVERKLREAQEKRAHQEAVRRAFQREDWTLGAAFDAIGA